MSVKTRQTGWSFIFFKLLEFASLLASQLARFNVLLETNNKELVIFNGRKY